MPKPAPLEASKDAIIRYFDARRPRAYKLADLRDAIHEQSEALQLPPGTRASEVMAMLEREGLLREAQLHSDEYRDITRYLWKDCTPIEIASTVRDAAYMSHGTAVFLHGLTQQLPRTFYVNYEQTPKPAPRGTLTQEAVDRAFRGKQRSSRYTWQFESNRFTVLSGKHTGHYGVEEMKGPSGEPLRVAGLERTLVDIAVRPTYAGGLYEVLEAYKSAREREVSVSRILATLKALDYRYPYHQSIGFLMERAGFEAKHLKRLRDLGFQCKFYLGYDMKKPDFDESWQLYIPQGF